MCVYMCTCKVRPVLLDIELGWDTLEMFLQSYK